MTKKYTEYQYVGLGLDETEVKLGKKQFSIYISVYPHLNKYSDLQLLEHLVYLEALASRYMIRIEEVRQTLSKDSTEKKKDISSVVSPQLKEKYDENLEQILNLKGKLGMFEDKEKLDSYRDLESLREKFALWRQKNQGSRKVTCPHCAKIFFLMIRTDKYDAKKFPFFEDKILCNLYLYEIYKDGQIAKDKYAQILGVSPDYIDWLDENHFKKKEKLLKK